MLRLSLERTVTRKLTFLGLAYKVGTTRSALPGRSYYYHQTLLRRFQLSLGAAGGIGDALSHSSVIKTCMQPVVYQNGNYPSGIVSKVSEKTL